MTSAGEFALFVARALIFATFLSVAHAFWRHRGAHRFDILALVGTFAFLTFPGSQAPSLEPLRQVVVLAQPWLVLRLVRHFADVSRAASGVALALAVAGAGAILVFGPADVLFVSIRVYAALAFAYAGIAFAREFRRTGGVSRKRLLSAALGSAAYSVVSVVVAWPFDTPSVFAADVAQALMSVMLFCFFLAFATPWRLQQRWQEVEQAHYLSQTSMRDPDDRGANAAADLNAAAARTVSHVVTFVALASPDASTLEVRASGDPALEGLVLEPGDHLLERVWRSGTPEVGVVDDAPTEIGQRLERRGAKLLVSPVTAGNQTWGVVGVVQRRGSLFPGDDLRLMTALGRQAGTALDHARLLADSRAQQHRATDRRVREIESRMSLMLDSIKDYAMVIVDDGGRVVNWHAGAEHVFGYSADGIRDEPAAPLFDLSTEAFSLLLHEATQLGLAKREGPCCKRDGSTFLGTTVIRPLDVAADRAAGFVAVTRDVTERRELEERLRQGQKMEAIGQLAGGIAHDFNNLLTAILGYADWLANDTPVTDRRRPHLEEIQKAAERAAGLTRQLLTFSRGQMVEPEVVNAARLVADLLPMLRRVIGEDIDVVGLAEADVSPILADRSQVEQIVLNLAVNARDAMPAGGRLVVRTDNVWLDEAQAGYDVAPGPFVLLEVIDSGHGMDEATQARIFEPFFTTKEPGRGTGLGLATVYGIVRQMGGAIRVKSEIDHGTTFSLFFPETRALAQKVPPLADFAVAGSETVLVAEDDESVRRFICQVLELHGYTVIEAADQARAVAAVQQHTGVIDLIVTDVLMPRGSGPELVRALAQVLPDVPALFISGYADGSLAKRVTFPKASHFLQKPFSAPELLARIRQLLSPPE